MKLYKIETTRGSFFQIDLTKVIALEKRPIQGKPSVVIVLLMTTGGQITIEIHAAQFQELELSWVRINALD